MDRAVYDRMKTLETSHWWFTGRRQILARAIGDLTLPKKARILEAGCGVGGNIEMLRQFGEVEAMEPDAPSRDYVQGRWGIIPSFGMLPSDVPYPAGRFDAVCAFDVVEHVEDDQGSVRALASLVAKDGYLVVTVPAYRWMWSRHDEAHHHKRRYAKAEVEALVRQAGLTPVRSTYFNALLLPLAAMVRGLKRLFRIETEDDQMPGDTVNAMLRRLFSFEASWLERGDLPFGLSILVIGKQT
jgi:SAM-dependent methyltransferase